MNWSPIKAPLAAEINSILEAEYKILDVKAHCVGNDGDRQ